MCERKRKKILTQQAALEKQVFGEMQGYKMRFV